MARSTRMLTLSVLASASLFAAACDGPSGIITDLGGATDPEGAQVEEPPVDDTIENPADGVREVPNRSDLTSPAPYPVLQLIGLPGSTTVRVEFSAQAGECTIHNAAATEFDDRVEVRLFQGLHPNVAAMTCMNVQEVQQILLTLDAPLGARELIVSGPSEPAPISSEENEQSGAIDASSYVGLTTVEATDRAQNAGIEWRIMRDGDEFFAGTADYRTDRINFEIDNGRVTTASIG